MKTDSCLSFLIIKRRFLSMTGIYIFKNTKEKKCYIGQSSRLEKRKYEHYHSSLKDEFHLNLIENPDNFEYKVLQECLVKELDDLELMWMNWYKNEGWELYNKDIYRHYTNRGKPHSEESKKKMSVSRKGKFTGPRKGKFTGTAPMLGKHHSEETRKKMSESHTGVVFSEEHRKKIGAAKKGKHRRRNPDTGKWEWY